MLLNFSVLLGDDVSNVACKYELQKFGSRLVVEWMKSNLTLGSNLDQHYQKKHSLRIERWQWLSGRGEASSIGEHGFKYDPAIGRRVRQNDPIHLPGKLSISCINSESVCLLCKKSQLFIFSKSFSKHSICSVEIMK